MLVAKLSQMKLQQLVHGVRGKQGAKVAGGMAAVFFNDFRENEALKPAIAGLQSVQQFFG
ncbi:hypothetical protein [Desulfonatronum parangueonense]